MEVSLPAQDAPAGKIKRLPQDVVNRIAAGEVVLRPSAAVKELLENSLDAGAKNIAVFTHGGGMKLLRITDDGSGVAPGDLELLCQRFATSKLRKYDDLRTVSTFGFRGEALASISHVSRVSVVTRHKDEPLGRSANYLDGALVEPPKTIAAKLGTILSVEDLFYNLATRRSALMGTSEEYRSIVDVVTRYSIRYPSTAFVCRRDDKSSGADVRTRQGATSTDNIRAAFGDHIAREVVPVEAKIEELGVSIQGLVTKSCFNMKKRIYVLFINGRLVECNPLKRAIDSAYAEFLPKGSHPFAYVSIAMHQEDIDVNVHPTKKEVLFLHEAEIVEAFTTALLDRLRVTNTSRTFLAQTENVATPRPRMDAVEEQRPKTGKRKAQLSLTGELAVQRSLPKTPSSQHVARASADANAGNMDLFLSRNGKRSPAVGLAKSRRRSGEAGQLLSSIQSAIDQLREDRDEKLAEIFKEHTFVGVASPKTALIQHETSLLLVEIAPVVRDLMFRQILMRFADFESYRFDPPVPVTRLLRSHPPDFVDHCLKVLFERKELLADYFHIGMEGADPRSLLLVSFPLVFPGITLDMAYVHELFANLGRQDNWTDESTCLLGIAAKLADVYGFHWMPSADAGANEGGMEESLQGNDLERRKWLLQYVLFASLRADYDPPKSFLDDNVVRELTNSAKLYKVFERC